MERDYCTVSHPIPLLQALLRFQNVSIPPCSCPPPTFSVNAETLEKVQSIGFAHKYCQDSTEEKKVSKQENLPPPLGLTGKGLGVGGAGLGTAGMLIDNLSQHPLHRVLRLHCDSQGNPENFFLTNQKLNTPIRPLSLPFWGVQPVVLKVTPGGVWVPKPGLLHIEQVPYLLYFRHHGF